MSVTAWPAGPASRGQPRARGRGLASTAQEVEKLPDDEKVVIKRFLDAHWSRGGLGDADH